MDSSHHKVSIGTTNVWDQSGLGLNIVSEVVNIILRLRLGCGLIIFWPLDGQVSGSLEETQKKSMLLRTVFRSYSLISLELSLFFLIVCSIIPILLFI